MLLMAMLAMVLAAAFPALAQSQGGEVDQEIDEQDVEIEDSICTNVQQVAANQYNAGDQSANASANASAGGEDSEDSSANASANASAIANELDVSQAVVQQCFNDGSVSASASADGAQAMGMTGGGGGGGGGGGSASASASASAAATEVLPETGGASLLALGAGALLVAGGLLARRIVRS